jgi:hypothetical protein
MISLNININNNRECIIYTIKSESENQLEMESMQKMCVLHIHIFHKYIIFGHACLIAEMEDRIIKMHEQSKK